MRGFKYIVLTLILISSIAFAVDGDIDDDGYGDDVDLFPNNPSEWIDTDLDGIGNNSDPDIDGDGLSNGLDNNGNILINGEDNNDDGDLAINIYDPLPHDPSEWLDTDLDGLGNNEDTDDDNDGVPDLLDVFPLNSQESLDSDNDGLGNNADPDDDTHRITGLGDGVLDVYDAFPLDPLETLDTDFDRIGNNADLDDDGDGVFDVDDAFPLDFNVNADQDGDGTGDAQDPDIDGDGIVNTLDVFPYDASEWYDTDGDGIGNNTDTDDDTHDLTGVGDGVLDVDDDLPLDPTETVDTDNDGIGNNADDDDDGDGVQDNIDAFPTDPLEQLDLDGDLLGNNSDPDIDGDGTLNTDDAFPFLANWQKDLDSDGLGDKSDSDIDGDGVTNGSFTSGNYNDPLDTVFNGNDAFPFNANEYIDTDGDGQGNEADDDDDGDGVDDSLDAFSLNTTESEDTDGDGIGNNADSDDDNDGIPDFNQDGSILDDFPLNPFEELDTDGDTIGNNTDLDIDTDDFTGFGDGVLNEYDAFPFDPAEWLDTDGDGLGNNADSDDDNDGIADINDAFPLDVNEYLNTDANHPTNSDLVGDNADLDDDGDGVSDGDDAFRLDANEQYDNDGDGTGDNSDSDDDNDSHPDIVDAFPFDAAEWFDTDGDGTGNNADLDDDGDTYDDNIDLFPFNKYEWLDADNDGIGDNADSDDDNDGVRDIDDAFPNNPVEAFDTDGDGLGNISDSDDDGDGFSDLKDQLPLNPTEHLDTDGDSIGNNADLDDDGDGMSDEFENSFNFNSLDASDALLDTDHDGINNVNEFIAETNPLRDDYDPIITPPQAVHIYADHTYTKLELSTLVELTQVSVSDGRDGENCCGLTAVGFETGAKNITAGLYPITWYAVDEAHNLAEVQQLLNVHPMVNFDAEQTVAEGGTARVNVTLSGDAPAYPLELAFSVSGTVDSSDYELENNSIIIDEGTEGSIEILINTDFELEGEEQLILTFVQAVNGGVHKTHIINVVETNVAPSITLTLEQDNILTNQVAEDDGEATINLEISDSNIDDTHVIDWELPDYLSADISANQLQVYIDPLDVELPDENKGLIVISVTVTDSGSTTNSGSEPLSQTKYFAFSLVDSLPRLSTTDDDTDGDGIFDIDEGFSDNDNDGLPEYLDTSVIPYLQPLHTNSSVFSLAETEPGLLLQLGKYAKLQYSDGLQLSEQEIEDTDLITADSLTHDGSYYDFVIDEISPFGRSVYIVLPLSEAIKKYAVYRKYSNENGWQDFVVDANNAVASSVAVNGVCPPPQSDLYQDGLIIGNVCLRLFIEDGGANDSDAIANGVIDDPGGIAIFSDGTIAKETVPEKSSSGSFSYYLLIGLALIISFRVHSSRLTLGKNGR